MSHQYHSDIIVYNLIVKSDDTGYGTNKYSFADASRAEKHNNNNSGIYKLSEVYRPVWTLRTPTILVEVRPSGCTEEGVRTCVSC